MIDNVRPPMGFRGFLVEDLTGWDGDQDAAGLRALCTAIRKVITNATAANPAVEARTTVGRQPAGRPVLDSGRVHLRYETETEGGTVTKEPPLVIGVLGAFGGMSEHRPSELAERSFITVSMGQRDAVTAQMAPQLRFSVPNRLDIEGCMCHS